jgi:hypothetical protein
MPVYEVTSPDGKTWEVNAPEGATQDQVLSYARSQWKPAQPAAPSAADDVGALEAGVIAAGRFTDKIVQGVRQAYNAATGDDKTLAAMAEEEAFKDKHYKALQTKHPVATTLGEAAPMMLVPMGAAGGLGATAAKAALINALPGAVGYGSAQERLGRAAVGGTGGAIGGAAGFGLARALKPASAANPGVSREALAAAKRLGVKPTPGQVTQNPALQNLENYLARTPGGSGTMQRAHAANQAAMNRAAAQAMGQQADDLSEGVFAAAKKGIGAEFDRLGAITSPQLGQDFFKVLADIDASNAARGSFRSKAIDDVVDKGLDLAAKGNLSGKAYKEIRSQLSSQANAAFKSGDATLGQAVKAIRNALDDAAEQSLGAADKQAWKTAREQWQAYKTLTKGNVAEGGNVSAARTAAAVRARGDGLRTGAAQGPLADIARIGEAFKAPANPNSGNLGTSMVFSNPLTGVPTAAGNALLARAMLSAPGRRYLENGLIDLGPAGRNALARVGGAGGGLSTAALLGVE